MADPRGFIKVPNRELPPNRPVPVRLLDYREVHDALDVDQVTVPRQAGRCMDCGVPFCHEGCPLGNLIPEWNHLVWQGRWAEAADRLHATNNFPEFTGRVCPAPCETACVLGISREPVTIKNVEVSIIEQAYADGNVLPQLPERLTGHTVAVVGSGPAGLAAAQQLTRAGHTVAVYERDDKVGGLLRYGIPNFKLEKRFIDRRVEQMEAEGTRFRTGVSVGTDITWDELRQRYDAVVVAIGSTTPRDLPIDGRDLNGIHFAMEFLHQANDRVAGEPISGQLIDAKDKNVVVIGGGDTGSDCVGTALRQGAASVRSLEITPRPTEERPASQPWPTYPMIYRVSSSHEEGGEREYARASVRAEGSDGNVESLVVAEAENFRPIEGTEHTVPADLILLAMGFVGPEVEALQEQLPVEITERGTVARDGDYFSGVPGVFVAGDAGRGQSLVVWAIAEGRSCAEAVDSYLMGSSQLPQPVTPTLVSMRL